MAQQQRKLKLPIPVSIITGALGVGKTTALCNLVQQKAPEEYWCIIVNEFGAVGIDAVAIESSAASAAAGTVTVRQLAGGCMCCVLAGPLSAAIAQIIRQVKPDRVIIEPSGLGHPGGLLDILQGPHLCSSLQVNAVICLVDLTTFSTDCSTLLASGTAQDQVSIADVLVGSKADVAPTGAADAFTQWATDELFPAKAQVLVMGNGRLDSALLDAPHSAATTAGQLLFKQGSRSRQQHAAASAAAAAAVARSQQPTSAAAPATPPAPAPGCPQRIDAGASNSGSLQSPYSSCGWIFHEQDVFDQAKLLVLLRLVDPAVARLKGVFRVAEKQWVMPTTSSGCAEEQQRPNDDDCSVELPSDCSQQQLVRQQQGQQQQSLPTYRQLQLQPVCYRGPSIVEIIFNSNSHSLPQLPGASAQQQQQLVLEHALVFALKL